MDNKNGTGRKILAETVGVIKEGADSKDIKGRVRRDNKNRYSRDNKVRDNMDKGTIRTRTVKII
jgi:hypothetical protein